MAEATSSSELGHGRFLRMEDLATTRSGAGLLGLSKATINRLHRDGDFPRKRRLTARCVGWWESEIIAWQRSRAASSHITSK